MENGQNREKSRKSEVFGEKVRTMRIEKGLTQAALARLVWPEIEGDENQDSKYAVKRKCISGYEQGIYPKNTNDLLRLCNALDCDMGYLFGEHECSTKDLQGVVDFTGLSESDVKNLVHIKEMGAPISTAVFGLLHDLLDSFSLLSLSIAYQRYKASYYDSNDYVVMSGDGKDTHFLNGDIGLLLLNQAFSDFVQGDKDAFVKELQSEIKNNPVDFYADMIRGK